MYSVVSQCGLDVVHKYCKPLVFPPSADGSVLMMGSSFKVKIVSSPLGICFLLYALGSSKKRIKGINVDTVLGRDVTQW
jgi:hypothetical protein